MEIFYENPNVKMSWDEENGCMHMEWKGFIYGEEFRTTMNKILEFAKKKKATKALADLRKLRVTNQEDQDWLVTNWTPRAVAIGLKYTASLVPESALAKNSFDRVIPRLVNGMEMVAFNDIEAARQWLRSR